MCILLTLTVSSLVYENNLIFFLYIFSWIFWYICMVINYAMQINYDNYANITDYLFIPMINHICWKFNRSLNPDEYKNLYKLIFLIMKIFVYNDFSDDSKVENLYTNFRILIKNLNCVIFIYLSIWNRLITSFDENKHCEQIQINTKKNSQYWNFLSKNNIKSTTRENITTIHHITPTT